jgi:hypothetical protein
MSILIAQPWLALIPAGAFLLLWRARGARLAALTAALWLGYAFYEYLMLTRVLCSGECNIRVDLLLIYPVLGLLSVAAMVVSLRRADRAP